jgi:16S rRNA (cytosine1402-N4)-methyltransferase
LRIFINNELGELENLLNNCLKILNPHGRIVVITFHSLEDVIVKQFFRTHSQAKISTNKYQTHSKLQNETTSSPLRIITAKPLNPSLSEVQVNPRSRSAKMRVAEFILGT